MKQIANFDPSEVNKYNELLIRVKLGELVEKVMPIGNSWFSTTYDNNPDFKVQTVIKESQFYNQLGEHEYTVEITEGINCKYESLIVTNANS